MGQQRVIAMMICTAAVLLASPPAPAMGTAVTNTRPAVPSTAQPQRQAAAPSGSTATPSSEPFDHEALWLAVAAMALAARNIAVRMR